MKNEDRRAKVRPMMRLPAVLAAVPMSEASLYVAIAQGEFPKPVRIGARAVAWLVDEIAEWQDARAAARDASE